jgi:hypothetical protein
LKQSRWLIMVEQSSGELRSGVHLDLPELVKGSV